MEHDTFGLMLGFGQQCHHECWADSVLRCFGDKNERSNYSLSGFLLYRADYWLSSAPYAKALALGTFTLLVILLGGFMIYMVKGTAQPGAEMSCQLPSLGLGAILSMKQRLGLKMLWTFKEKNA